jgi:hypothetical protein
MYHETALAEGFPLWETYFFWARRARGIASNIFSWIISGFIFLGDLYVET